MKKLQETILASAGLDRLEGLDLRSERKWSETFKVIVKTWAFTLSDVENYEGVEAEDGCACWSVPAAHEQGLQRSKT